MCKGIDLFAKWTLTDLEKEILEESDKYLKGGIVKWMIEAKEQLLDYILGSTKDYLYLFRNVFLSHDAVTTCHERWISEPIPFADLAYEAFKNPAPTKIDISLNPINLKFNAHTLSHKFQLTKDLCGIVGEYDGEYYLAFRGTDNIKNLITDIHQFILGADITYLMAIGILSKLCEQFPDKRIYVTGHSLGGGLAQYATLAINDYHVSTFCYNSAGLSYESVERLARIPLFEEYIMDPKIYHLHVSSDLVFRLGNQFGYCRTIPSHKNAWDAHKLDTIRELTNCKDIAWFK